MRRRRRRFPASPIEQALPPSGPPGLPSALLERRPDIREAQHQQALLGYRQAIQHAFGDVSDALIGYQKLHEVRQRQEDTVADLVESVRLSECATKAAPRPTSKSSTAGAPRFSVELTFAQARGHGYHSLVQLCRPLGGG